MKKNRDLLPLLGLATLLFLGACRKADSTTDPTLGGLRTAPSPGSGAGAGNQDSVPVVLITDSQTLPPPVLPPAPLPQQSAPQNSCPSLPIYGDTIIFPQPTSGSDYIVTPVNNPGPGKYLSWPVGMVLDSTTGAIDVTASETGLMYVIGYVKAGTSDTCLSTLIIGGASYADSIYILSEGQTQAVPYFDANPDYLSLCSSGNGCSFDVTGSAAKAKVIVDKSTGVIDLEKTLNGTGLLGGAFGLLPLNGQTVTTTIYYRLNDPSNDALQSINVQLVYYADKSLINSLLLSTVLSRLDNLLLGTEISSTTNPRPPLIVIVRNP